MNRGRHPPMKTLTWQWNGLLPCMGSGIDDFPSTYKGGMMNLDDAVQEAMVLLVSHIEREVDQTVQGCPEA